MRFTKELLRWYGRNKRDLPWRNTSDPYLIWLSEIILQQTRIEQGLPYYVKFTGAYPEIKALASASEEDVLKLWQGLGYYNRALNMHKTAQQIMIRFDGHFPDSYANILTLKGVGEYTAAAIASIAFHLPHPVVDGNVLRFFSRHFGVKDPITSVKVKRAIREKATELIDLNDPGTFNQAIMEFGARICIPGNPPCSQCLFHQSCFAFSNQLVNVIPVSTKPSKRRVRHFNYLVINSENGNSLILKKRTAQDIWKGLYDFPLIETSKAVTVNCLKSMHEWSIIKRLEPESHVYRSTIFRHVLTHQEIFACFFEIKVARVSELPEGWKWVYDLKKVPVPRLIEKFLERRQRFF